MIPVLSWFFNPDLLFPYIKAHSLPGIFHFCSSTVSGPTSSFYTLIQNVSGTLFLFPAYILLTYPASMIPAVPAHLKGTLGTHAEVSAPYHRSRLRKEKSVLSQDMRGTFAGWRQNSRVQKAEIPALPYAPRKYLSFDNGLKCRQYCQTVIPFAAASL